MELASFTYAVAVDFHLFPVFQVHGPDVAFKQAWGVRNCVCPCAADTQAVESDYSLQLHTSALFRGCPGSWLPSSSFAFLIRNGDVEALVVDVNQRPEGGNRGTDQSCLNFRDCDWKKKPPNQTKKKSWGDLLVIVDQKTLHDEDMDPFLLQVSLISLRRQADAVGAGELDRVLLPSSHGVDHRLHVQGVDHWYRTGENRERRPGFSSATTAAQYAAKHTSHC